LCACVPVGVGVDLLSHGPVSRGVGGRSAIVGAQDGTVGVGRCRCCAHMQPASLLPASPTSYLDAVQHNEGKRESEKKRAGARERERPGSGISVPLALTTRATAVRTVALAVARQALQPLDMHVTLIKEGGLTTHLQPPTTALLSVYNHNTCAKQDMQRAWCRGAS
jgi:hypothetical protein